MHLIKQNCLLKTKNSNLDDSGISLPVFPSSINLKLHNIFVSPKMAKKVIMNLDLSKANKSKANKFFNKCLKEFFAPDCGKVSSVVPVFKNVEERSTAKKLPLC